MPRECELHRLRHEYARLLRLYPKPFRERFAESMEQTFSDFCRANASSGRDLTGLALWLYIDTVGGIVREHLRVLFVRHPSIIRAAWVTLGVMVIPSVGALCIDDWHWGWRGFGVVGAFVFGTALAYQFAVRGTGNKSYRWAMALAVATALVLAWNNFVLAVDVRLGNFMYLGVVVVGLVGAAIARLRARAMGYALAAMTIAQMLVPVIGLSSGRRVSRRRWWFLSFG